MKQRLVIKNGAVSLFLHIATAPFIYSLIIPFVILDVFLETYHRICFPVYGIPYIKRSAYIRIDRHKLSFLSPIEKVHCMYCGYCNGLTHYASQIAGASEKYWCGIRHEQKEGFQEPLHHKDFLPRTAEALDEYLASLEANKN